jgi:hypothetical protein
MKIGQWMFLTVAINFSIGILVLLVPQINTAGNEYMMGGMQYNVNQTDVFREKMQVDVNPSSILQDKGNQIYRILDLLNIGFIWNFAEYIKTMFFGLPVFLHVLIGPSLTPQMDTFLFAPVVGVIYILFTMIYIIEIWMLWTGRDIK